MNQKEKIIILVSFTFFSLTVLFPFFNKKNFPKNNHQYLYFRKKKEKTSVFRVFLILFGIIIVIFVLFFISEKIKNPPKIKKEISEEEKFIKEIKKLTSKNEIESYLGDENILKN